MKHDLNRPLHLFMEEHRPENIVTLDKLIQALLEHINIQLAPDPETHLLMIHTGFTVGYIMKQHTLLQRGQGVHIFDLGIARHGFSPFTTQSQSGQ
ncbi:hypothetical protein D3C87_1063610 [compost metagenome]